MTRPALPDAGALVIGVGNPACGDDAVGPLVAAAVARSPASASGAIAVLDSGGDALALIDAWAGRGRVVVVDACRGGAAAGAVRRFDAGRVPLPAQFGAVSTHGVGLAAAVEIARALGRLPAALIVYGVEGARFGTGDPPSAPVVAAVDVLAARIVAELAAPID